MKEKISAMVKAHKKLTREIWTLQYEKESIESDIIKTLCKEGKTGYLGINWTRLKNGLAEEGEL